jgi:Brp/Blh family beta-carotene 15,15'-monooxygenase
MHAASIMLLSWAMIGAAFLFSAASATGVVVLAALVAMIGLPHGAADHRFARSRFMPLLGAGWLPFFLLGYLTIASVVVAGWVQWPAATVIGFLVASAWHFGQEEPGLAVGPRLLRPLFRFARGGVVIWAAFVFRGGEVFRLFSIIAPRGIGEDFPATFEMLRMLSWGMLALAAIAWVLQGVRAAQSGRRRRRVLLLDNAMVASLVALCALTPPLVGFLVYFCGWHSARGLRRLRRELGETWPQLVLSLTPMTLVAILLTVGGVGWALPAAHWNDTVVRATFMGLSAVAVPHLLLHGVAPLLRPRGRRDGPPLSRPATLGGVA